MADGQGSCSLCSNTAAMDRPRRTRGVDLAVLGAAVIVLVAGGLAATRAIDPPPPATSALAAAPPRFVDETSTAGIAHTYAGDYPYVVGGGIATFDCDGDGLADLYVAGGSAPASMFRNRSEVGGALRFEAVADPITGMTAVTGAYPLDIDGDRQLDLVVLRIGEDVILRGLGACRFERANEALSFRGGDSWTVGFSATWETPSSALPTLAFGDYLVGDGQDQTTSECADDRLVRPASSGLTYGTPIALSPSYCTLSMLFSDWDRSGRRDLRVSNDRHYYHDGEEQLWRIEAGLPPRPYGREDGWQPMHIWGMGIASQDVTGDRYPEVYLTSQGDNKLQTLADGPTQPRYEDIALRRGVTAHRPYAGDETRASTAWHPAFEDVNNDGLTDLFVSKGNVEFQTEYASKDPSNLLIGQSDGTFVEGAMEAGIVHYDRGRGAALVDFNLDGQLDLVQVVRREPVRVWRNVGRGTAERPASMGHWLAVDLEQDAADHDAVGAWIAVRTGGREIEREVTVGGGHASGSADPAAFRPGNGRRRRELRVTWPDGEVGPWLPVDADGIVTVRRGATAVEPVGPGAAP